MRTEPVALVEVVRSGFRESVHRGSVVLLATDGRVQAAIGRVATPVLPRSSTKPVQALAMLRSGLELTQRDLAIATASHSGEPEHVERVRALLARHGLGVDALRCPPAEPLHAPSARVVATPATVFMNCSGKHAAMLATCVVRGWDTAGYLRPAHPVQHAVASTLSELAGEPVATTAVDGCGAPCHAVSLTGLARAFARLVTGAAERRVADAMRAHPHLVAGTDREDTLLMRAVPGLVCKVGAEGVHAGALPDGRAFALKIEDGALRARLPVTVGALRALGVAVPSGLDELPIRGGGAVVGGARLLSGALPAAECTGARARGSGEKPDDTEHDDQRRQPGERLAGRSAER